MATQAIQGYKGIVKASSSTGGALAKVAEIRGFSIMTDADEIDVTTQESSGDREFLLGNANWTAKLEELHLSTNAGHGVLFDLLQSGLRANYEFYPTGSSSIASYSGQGLIKHWELSAPNADAEVSNVDVRGTGVLTRA